MIYKVDFTENKKLNMKMPIKDHEYMACELNLAGGCYPHVSADLFVNLKIRNVLNVIFKDKKNFITCQLDDGGVTLINCTLSNSYIFPEYIYFGNKTNEFSGVSVAIPGLYEFFNGSEGFDFKNNLISKELKEHFLDFYFHIENEKYHLDIQHWVNTEGNGHKVIIEQDAVVKITRIDGVISFEEAANLSKRIVGLFSLLLGFDLSIKNVWLHDLVDDFGRPFYFLAGSKSDIPFKSWPYTFLQTPHIMNNNEWKSVFDHYFSKEYSFLFDRFWIRLTKLFSYEGFWEYKVLGIFSLLEAYIDNATGSCQHISAMKLYFSSKTEISNAEKNLVRYKENLEKRTKLTSRESDIFDKAFSLMKRRKVNFTFNNAFDYFISEIFPADFLQVLDFSDGDIKLIKKIRDAAAHALPLDAAIKDDFQRIQMVRSKVTVLLFYLAFEGLGFSKELFTNILLRNMYLVKNEACLSNISMRRILAYKHIYKVSVGDLSEIGEINGFNHPVIISSMGAVVDFKNSKLKSLVSLWHSGNRNDLSLIEFIKREFTYNESFTIEMPEEVYFYSESASSQLTSPVMLRVNDSENT